MSLLEKLRQKKTCLKSTRTIVTYPNGRSFLEEKNKSPLLQIDKQSFGFIVDTSPDNIPAQIIDYLYLGSQDCCELNVLQEFKIEYVLSIGIEPSCAFPTITYKFVKCLDLPDTDIVAVLKNDCLDFLIDAVTVRSRNVLVHCNAGVSRSSAIVLGYLILVQNLSYDKAFDLVKSKRNCIRPNDGFVKQLQELGRILNCSI